MLDLEHPVVAVRSAPTLSLPPGEVLFFSFIPPPFHPLLPAEELVRPLSPACLSFLSASLLGVRPAETLVPAFLFALPGVHPGEMLVPPLLLFPPGAHPVEMMIPMVSLHSLKSLSEGFIPPKFDNS